MLISSFIIFIVLLYTLILSIAADHSFVSKYLSTYISNKAHRTVISAASIPKCKAAPVSWSRYMSMSKMTMPMTEAQIATFSIR